MAMAYNKKKKYCYSINAVTEEGEKENMMVTVKGFYSIVDFVLQYKYGNIGIENLMKIARDSIENMVNGSVDFKKIRLIDDSYGNYSVAYMLNNGSITFSEYKFVDTKKKMG